MYDINLIIKKKKEKKRIKIYSYYCQHYMPAPFLATGLYTGSTFATTWIRNDLNSKTLTSQNFIGKVKIFKTSQHCAEKASQISKSTSVTFN